MPDLTLFVLVCGAAGTGFWILCGAMRSLYHDEDGHYFTAAHVGVAGLLAIALTPGNVSKAVTMWKGMLAGKNADVRNDGDPQ